MSIGEFISKLGEVIINPIIKLLFAAAIVTFLWGIVQYIQNADSPDGRETGRKVIIWGILGLVIMVSVFSIMQIAKRTVFGV